MGTRRAAAVIVLAAALVCLGTATVLADPSPSPSPTPNVCGQIPQSDLSGFVARVSCNLAPSVGQAISGAAGQVGQAAAGAAEIDLNSWLANGAAWMVQTDAQLIVGSSTTPNLDPSQAASFALVYGRVVGVALSLSVLLVLIGIIEATLTQRPGALRRVVAGMAVSGIGLGAVPVGTAVLVRITDDLSGYVAGQAQGIATGLSAVVKVLLQTPVAGDAVFALVAVGLMAGGALLWLEMVVRASLIYVFLGVAPLACAAAQWPRLEGVLRQVLFGGLALILSKLVVVIVLAVGFAVLPAGGGLQGLLSGMFIVLIAALMPFATARVLPLAAEELSLSHQGRIRGWAMSSVGTTARIVSAASGVGTASAATAIQPRDSTGRRAAPGASGSADAAQPTRSDSARLPAAATDAGSSSSAPPRPVGPPPRRRPHGPEPPAAR
jgi:hypothetical protein